MILKKDYIGKLHLRLSGNVSHNISQFFSTYFSRHMEKELVSMLFYLGYLTIIGDVAGYSELGIPNKVMKEKVY